MKTLQAIFDEEIKNAKEETVDEALKKDVQYIIHTYHKENWDHFFKGIADKYGLKFETEAK